MGGVVITVGFRRRELRASNLRHYHEGFPHFIRNGRDSSINSLFGNIEGLVAESLCRVPLVHCQRANTTRSSHLFMVRHRGTTMTRDRRFFYRPQVAARLFNRRVRFGTMGPHHLGRPLTIFRGLVRISRPAIQNSLTLLPRA